MPKSWTGGLQPLRGDLMTLREIAPSDVYSLFTLFRDPAVTAYMAPPPPTLATFAGFVMWSIQEREQGRGLCFGIVPDGMTTAVGILQVRSLSPTSSSAEWGFVLSSHFWSTGLFFDAANVAVDFAFKTVSVDRLEARIALRNRRAHLAVQKLGARLESTLETPSPQGITRDPELVWVLQADGWRARDPGAAAGDERQRVQNAVEAAESELHRREAPDVVEPYPLFLFDRRRRRGPM